MRKPLTGEPCAGKLHARFGGRGGLGLLYPYQKVTHVLGFVVGAHPVGDGFENEKADLLYSE